MDFRLTEEQAALRSTVRALLETHFGPDRLRAAAGVAAAGGGGCGASGGAGGSGGFGGAGGFGGCADGSGNRGSVAEWPGGVAVPAARPGGSGSCADGRGSEGPGAKWAGGRVDRELWRHLGAVGFFGLRLPEEHPSGAGAGLGLPEAVLIFEEAGRALVPGPLLATHLAAGLVEGAATGEVIVTAMDGGPHGIPPEEEMEGSPSEGAVRAVRAMRVVRVGEAGEAEGAVRAGEAEGVVGVEGVAGADALVEHLSSADAVLVIGGTAVAVLLPDRITARPLRSVDPLTPLHRHEAAAGSRGVVRGGADSPGSRAAALASDGVPTQFGSPRCQAAELRREAVLLTAAQQLGSAGRTVEAAVLHARERRQFGQAIGAFQAIKHLCADMLVRAELARSAVYAAAVTGDGDDIAAAKLLADEAAVRNARDCLQVSGGMGFTWESEVHLHLKRAWLRAGQWLSESSAEEALAASLVEAEPAAGR